MRASIPITPDLLHGILDLESTPRGIRPHRLPPAVRDRDADPHLLMMESQPAGARVVFTTSATSISLEVHASRVTYRGMDRTRGAIDAFVDEELCLSQQLKGGDLTEIDLRNGSTTFTAGRPDLISVGGLARHEKRVELWLPHNEQVDLVALQADAPVLPVRQSRPIWLHHGSSISHGSNAATPSGTWPSIAARAAGVELYNLGFGGSALVDPFMARLIRDTPADLISVKLGINVVNHDAMRARTFVPAVHGFLDTIRDGHPTTPLLLISPIYCGLHEETPGPGGIDPTSLASQAMRFTATGTPGDTALGRLTLEVIRELLADIAAARADDPNLYHLNGLDLYGTEDARRHPLPDGLHPDGDTHDLIGRRFVEAAFTPQGVFGDHTAPPKAG